MVRVRGNCHCHQPRNNRHDCADVNRRKRYTRYLRNFDRPLWLSGCRRQCFLTSAPCHLFKKQWHESVITAVDISHGACRHRLYFAISWKNHNLARSFRRLSCVAASRILLYTNTHYHMGQQEEPVVDTCSPRRQAIQMGHARTRVVRNISLFCFCVTLCGILCCHSLFIILIVIKFILFY